MPFVKEVFEPPWPSIQLHRSLEAAIADSDDSQDDQFQSWHLLLRRLIHRSQLHLECLHLRSPHSQPSMRTQWSCSLNGRQTRRPKSCSDHCPMLLPLSDKTFVFCSDKSRLPRCVEYNLLSCQSLLVTSKSPVESLLHSPVSRLESKLSLVYLHRQYSSCQLLQGLLIIRRSLRRVIRRSCHQRFLFELPRQQSLPLRPWTSRVVATEIAS